VFGEKSVSKRDKQQVTEGDDYHAETVDYGTQTVTIPFEPGSSAVLESEEGSGRLLVLDSFLLSGGGRSLSFDTGASPKDGIDPKNHVGDSPSVVYEYGGSINISSFLASLPPDQDGNVTFTITRRYVKEVEWLPDDEPGNDGGEPGGGSGGPFPGPWGGPGDLDGGPGGPGGGSPWNAFYGSGLRREKANENDNVIVAQNEEQENEEDFSVYACSSVVLTVSPGGCSSCTGEGNFCVEPSNDSVGMKLGLGRGEFGESAGALEIKSDIMTPLLSTPQALSLKGGSDFEAVRIDSTLRQVRGPNVLADIIVESPYQYKINLYPDSAVGPKVDGLYTVSGSPIKIFDVKNPDFSPTLYNRLSITTLNGQGLMPKEVLFEYEAATNTMSLTTGNGSRIESLQKTWNTSGTELTERRIVKNHLAEIISDTEEIYRLYPWGREMIKQTLDPTGKALVTTWEYETSMDDPYSYSRLVRMERYDGYWERHTYGAGQFHEVVTPFKASSIDAPDTESRIRRSRTSTSNPMKTEEEYIQGVLVARSWEALVNGEIWTITANDPASNWRSASNTITRTLSHTTGEWVGRPISTRSPDGSLATYQYHTDPQGHEVVTIHRGYPDGTGQTIIDGTQTIRTIDKDGLTIAETVTDIASGLQLTGMNVTARDEYGRMTRTDYADGTHTTRTFTCCGLTEERRRDGLTYRYTYDELGHRETSTMLIAAPDQTDVTIKSIHDPEGRVVQTIRYPKGVDPFSGTGDVLTESFYNPAGQMIEQIEVETYSTTYDETHGPNGTVRTMTQPDSETRIETIYPDGQIIHHRHRRPPDEIRLRRRFPRSLDIANPSRRQRQ